MLTVEQFRQQRTRELAEAGDYLAGWMEIANQKPQTISPDDRRPFTENGREFRDFSETLCQVLAWYKPHKISTFRDLGWQFDPAVVDRVRRCLKRLCAEGIRSTSMPERISWLSGFDPDPIAQYTAMDVMFQTVTGKPIRTVLDFGSGIGRQAFAWVPDSKVTFFSVDAIESLYILQNEIYLRLFPDRLVEYFQSSEECSQRIQTHAGQLFHVPTWKLTMIPDRSVDLLIAVQVIQELNESTLRYLLKEFRRIVRSGGFFYIRDNEFWTPEHKIRFGRALLETGWELAFKYPGNEGTDISGIPRLWVYTGADTSRYFRPLVRLKRTLLPSYSLSYGSWRDIGLPI